MFPHNPGYIYFQLLVNSKNLLKIWTKIKMFIFYFKNCQQSKNFIILNIFYRILLHIMIARFCLNKYLTFKSQVLFLTNSFANIYVYVTFELYNFEYKFIV